MTNPTPLVLTQTTASEIFGTRPKNVPEFKFLADVPRAEAETFLIYGASGTGKTRAAGTCGDRALFISNGDGASTLQSPAFRRDINANPIIVSLAEKLGSRGVFENAEVYDAICDTIDYALKAFPEKFDFIVVDDATQLRRGALNKGLEFNKATGKSKTLDQRDRVDMIVPAVQDYGIEMNLVEQFVAGYTQICKNAGKHFILNAHERITFRKGEKIGDTPTVLKISPGFTGQTFPDTVPNYFDNVWRMEVIGGGNARVWRATTQGNETVTAKTRMSGILDTTEDNINFIKIVEKMKSGTLRGIKAPMPVPVNLVTKKP